MAASARAAAQQSNGCALARPMVRASIMRKLVLIAFRVRSGLQLDRAFVPAQALLPTRRLLPETILICVAVLSAFCLLVCGSEFELLCLRCVFEKRVVILELLRLVRVHSSSCVRLCARVCLFHCNSVQSCKMDIFN